jgi:hypothetical protein
MNILFICFIIRINFQLGWCNMGRTSSRINDLERRVAKLEENEGKNTREIKDIKRQVELLTDDRIIQMLQEVNSPYSDKPRYSYDEISAASGRSTGYISNLAKDNGLSRRNLKSV